MHWMTESKFNMIDQRDERPRKATEGHMPNSPWLLHYFYWAMVSPTSRPLSFGERSFNSIAEN